jgi:transcriptional regulator with XRE-family HTH domain
MLSLGKAIKMIRSARGHSLSVVAEQAQVGVPFLSLIESGERQPSLATLRKVADALGVPPEVLVLLALEGSGGSLRAESEAALGLTAALKKVAAAEEELKRRLRDLAK